MASEGGSKTIERIGKIFRALEAGPEGGMSTSEIASATGCDKATVYRAMVSLTRIGLLDRDAEAKRFRLGVYLFHLGAVTAKRFSVLSHARAVLQQIALETGDTVFLSVRNQFQSVCIDSATGSFPIRAHTLSVGDSIPLGMSAGGLAMLATMADHDVRHALQFNALDIYKFNSIKPEDIYRHVELTRERGYAHYAGHIIAGMGAVARAIRGPKGDGIAVISVTALLERLSERRVDLINDLLRDSIEKIEQRALLIGSGS